MYAEILHKMADLCVLTCLNTKAGRIKKNSVAIFRPLSTKLNPLADKKIDRLQMVKGIVSGDLHICFFVSIDRSEIPTPYGAVRLLASRSSELTQ
jgi:hypothetical protein